MNKVVYFAVEDKKYPLVFTYGVSEYVEQKYGSFDEFAKTLKGKKIITACADMLAILMAQGAAYVKRKMKDMPMDEDICLEPMSREDILIVLGPTDYTRILTAINEAFDKGMKNDIEATEKPGKNAKSA